MARAKRVALVTGGASGIGRASAERLAAAGDHVILADRNLVGAEAAAAAIAEAGGSAEARPLDVGDDAAIEALAAELARAKSVPAVLVTAAGILQDALPLDGYALADHDRLWRINYRSVYLCCRAFGGLMAKAGRGAICNIASVTSFRSTPLHAYAPAKAALITLTQQFAAELGPYGVRVNAVAPGWTLTPAIRERIESGRRDPSHIVKGTPLGRLVEPAEVAAGVAFLCSDDASAVTGIALPIDCGWLAGSSWEAFGGLRRPSAAG